MFIIIMPLGIVCVGVSSVVIIIFVKESSVKMVIYSYNMLDATDNFCVFTHFLSVELWHRDILTTHTNACHQECSLRRNRSSGR